MTSSSSEDDDFMMCQLLRQNRKKRRYWVHPYNEGCSTKGNFQITKQLVEDQDKFQSYYRMLPDTYKLLLELVGPSLKKEDTKFRESVSAGERLLIILRFLATGSSFRSMSYVFMRGETTIGQIIDEGCAVIWQVLQPLYMKKPSTTDWLKNSEKFLELWNLPHCIGALDGKHIRIKKPTNSGSAYFNYKEYFSINLMACADANGLFTSIDVGDYGRNNDSGVFRNSSLGRSLSTDTLNIPKPSPLPGEELGPSFPYYFAADEGFPLCVNIIRPYNQRNLTNIRRIFNYRLSRGRKIVESTFGMLVSKFRVFETPTSCSVSKSIRIVKAACVLHNFIKITEKVHPNFSEEKTSIENISNLKRYLSQNQGRPSSQAIQNRDYLSEYFIKPYGPVPWQANYIV